MLNKLAEQRNWRQDANDKRSRVNEAKRYRKCEDKERENLVTLACLACE